MQKTLPNSWISGSWRATLAVFALVAASPARAEPPAAYDVRVESAESAGGRETRLIFSLDACVAQQAYVLDQPPRAVLDLPEVKFLIDPSHGDPASETRTSRRGLITVGRCTITSSRTKSSAAWFSSAPR